MMRVARFAAGHRFSRGWFVAVVSCPKCSAGLRVPDGSVAAVRCPKCTTVFQPPKPTAATADFEVVDDAPPKPAPRAASRPASPPPPPPPPTQKKAFSLDDAVRSADKRPRRDDRDDDRDRDRERGRRDRDDDDRPRSRRRDRDDEDDYDDRRDRRRRDDYDDEDDRDWDRDDDRRRKPSKYGLARPGTLLILISLGLYFGGMALHALLLFVAWVGAVVPYGLVVVTGVLGLLGWVVALVGLSLTIAGPAKVRGLAIAATAVAVVHLILVFVVANNERSGGFGSGSIGLMSAASREDRRDSLQRELMKEAQSNPNGQRVKDLQADLADYNRDLSRLGSGDGMRWHDLATALPRLDALVAVLVYSSRGFEHYLWSLFAGLFELARLVLLGLLIGALARAAKDHRAADQAKFGWIAGSAAVGVGLLALLLAALLAESAAKDAARAITAGPSASPPPMPQFNPQGNFQQQQAEYQRQMEDWRRQQQDEMDRQRQRVRSAVRAPLRYIAGGELVVYVLHAGALVLPALAALGVFKSMGRRR